MYSLWIKKDYVFFIYDIGYISYIVNGVKFKFEFVNFCMFGFFCFIIKFNDIFKVFFFEFSIIVKLKSWFLIFFYFFVN